METLKTKNRVKSTFLTKLLKNVSLLWSLLFRIKFINYSFKELRSLFFALCLYLQKNIEIWCLTLLLKSGNIVHELVTESFTNQKTRLTIVHERLFSINLLVLLSYSVTKYHMYSVIKYRMYSVTKYHMYSVIKYRMYSVTKYHMYSVIKWGKHTTVSKIQ
jgi:hypothetical protein